jgi:hypothetical protein
MSEHDTELLALGVKLDALVAEFRIQEALDRVPGIETLRARIQFWTYEAVVDAILAQTARTLAGLQVQVRAVMIDKDLPPDARAFVDAVCRFAGITPMPLTV